MKKLKVGIDARTISEKGGVRRYVINLINNLSKLKDIDLIIFYNDKKLIGTFKKCKEISLFPHRKFLLPIYDLLILPLYCKKMKIDVLHLPKSSCNFFKSFKKVTTLHDLIPITHPETEKKLNWLYWKLNFWLVSKFADKIITVSNFSKQQIIENYKVDKGKITVIYHGADKKIEKRNKKEIEQVKKKYNLKNKFLLFVGTIQPRKNTIRCIEAISLFREKNKEKLDFVIAGRKGWKVNSKLLNKNFVKILGFVPEKDLANLYKNAEALLYVSLNEGFGFPIIEAQSYGCPVITSNISSMPEIAGKGAILVNPYNINEIKTAIKKLTRDKSLRDNLIKEGYKNKKRFSWEKCARKTLNIYKNIYIGKHRVSFQQKFCKIIH
jgi:glycosyltransferase involved in cell wall biosynthesis